MQTNPITQSYLQECFTYDPDSGDLIWNVRPESHFKTALSCRRSNTRSAGEIAGVRIGKGWQIKLLGQAYKAHRLVWLHLTGRHPENDIDHINGDQHDNRIANLRDVTNQENRRNMKRDRRNKSGATGVHEERGKFRAQICVAGRRVHLGRFDTIEQAATARKAAEIRYGFHANHGRAPQ